MEDFFKMDVFFVIATMATLIATVGISIILVYVIRLVRTLNRISHEVEEEVHVLRADINETRQNLRSKGLQFKTLFRFVEKSFKHFFSSKK